MSLGNHLFQARKKRGFSQEEVAEKLGITLEEYREAFRQPEDYISVKLMFQQCIEHYVYERPFTDYGNENGILSGSLEEIEKSVVAGLFRKIIKDCAIVGGGAGDKLNLYH